MVGGHNALKIVYRNGLDYWGVEETSWTDPPLLRGASETIRHGDRSYNLYYDGRHLQMVSFTEHGAAYWVTNSLLQGIPNAAMIRIAEGLRGL